jgi:alginate O-acetyltransferase complex protein AlgI
VTGVTLNLACLAVFKYADFLVDNANLLFGTVWPRPGLPLPPGISFFTFTQIAFLVDARRGAVTHSCQPVSYSLFVNWFPHLIAGPVLHHAKMMPQFASITSRSTDGAAVASGLNLFALGMAKKLLLADPLALLASPVFDSAARGLEPSFAAAWYAAFAYSFQIYFDFSGYSDMAMGVSRLFRVELPVNFASPYKAANIIDFWRRWHISLSSFLRDYLYIPLGGNRKGPVRRHLNLMITMLLGGLWHGASWGFVLWGGLHGLYLVINHLWSSRPPGRLASLRGKAAFWIEAFFCLVLVAALVPGFSTRWIVFLSLILLAGMIWRHCLLPAETEKPAWVASVVGVGGTFLLVTVSWVFFRSTSIAGAWEMLQGMMGANGWASTVSNGAEAMGVRDLRSSKDILFASALIIWLAPDSGVVSARLVAAGRLGALISGLLMLACLVRIGKPSEFLYFQF